MSSSAMDSLMSTVDTITSAADSDDPCTACTSPMDVPGGFVAKSPPPSPKDNKLASSGVNTTPPSSVGATLPPPGTPPGTTSSLLTTSSKQHLVQSSPTNTASSLKTRSLDGLLHPGLPHHGLDATSTTTTVSDASSGRGARGSTRDENAFLFLGCVQALLGVLMAVFGVLAMLHRASMASVGAGVWGGAISFVSGVAGVIAGLRSCYSSSMHGGSGSGRPPIAPTVFMALSLVALAVSNLVLVLAAIGLVRDARTPDIQLLREDEDVAVEESASSPGSSHWERVLASCGLLVVSGLQLLAAIASGYRCYRLVCPCAARTSRKHSPLYNQRSSGSPDSLHSVSGLYSSGSKERLVSRWLTRQVPNGPVYTGSPTPSGLLLFSTQPPPPAGRDGRAPGFTAISPGHHPQTVYTLTQPPSPGPPYMSAGVPTYPGGLPSGLPYYSHYINSMMGVGHPRTRYQHRQHRQQRHHQVPTLPSDERLRRDRERQGRHRGERDPRDVEKARTKPKPKPVTEADVARTYTGLDRRIAEEFIMAMDNGLHRPGRQGTAEEATRVD